MAKNRMINTKIWEDAWFNGLDPIEKLFFIYLLTNPMTNIIGVYELSKGTIGRSTGLESKVVDEILFRFEKSEKIYYLDGWVIIRNFVKHQNYRSPKIIAGMDSEKACLPDKIKNFIDNSYGIDTISHLNSNSNSNLNSNSNSNLTKLNTNTATPTAIAGKEINDIILLFEKVNPSFRRLYKNTTQREALFRLVKQHGKDRVEFFISLLPQTNQERFAPTITTPLQLEDKLAQLAVFLKKSKPLTIPEV